MRQLKKYGFLILLFAGFLISAGGTGSDSLFINEEPVIEREKNLNVVFGDSLTGWAVGAVKTGGWQNAGRPGTVRADLPAVIMKTTDGGKSWFLQSVIQADAGLVSVQTVYASDASHAWVFIQQINTGEDFLLRTQDGSNWKVMKSPLADITPERLFFLNPINGWAIGSDWFGNKHLFETTDGGNNWKESRPPTDDVLLDLGSLGDAVYLLTINKSQMLSILSYGTEKSEWNKIKDILLPVHGSINRSFVFQRASEHYIILNAYDNSVDKYNSCIIYSNDRFFNFRCNPILPDTAAGMTEPAIIAAALLYQPVIMMQSFFDKSASIEEETGEVWMYTSSGQGQRWQRTSGISYPAVAMVSPDFSRLVVSTGQGELLYSADAGNVWNTSTMDFKGVFKPAPVATEKSLGGLDELSYFDDRDADSDKDTVHAGKWESAEDSLLAVSFASVANIDKYKADPTVDFSVGIDSVMTDRIILHKRIRRGARHGTWDLLREEQQKGAIRIPRYKTIRLSGSVHAVNQRKAVRYSWSSSLAGELSHELCFTTHPRQLAPGVHYIFFKAQNDLGEWSKPVVFKCIVEDFPKYKFPFYGTWVVGGSGSYFNRGRHIKGISYALDLNYAEGDDGGDSDHGIPVRASTDGVVVYAGYTKGYGRNVRINYEYAGRTYTTLVSHLAAISVEVGEKVKQGQELGTCGSTGRSSAPHIHWELRVDNICVPPEPIFENDTTVIQTIRDGGLYTSDNYYQPRHIIVVDEGDIPNTWAERKGYNHSYRWAGIQAQVKTAEAVWRPKLPQSGLYKVQAHIPRDHATAVATYKIHTRNGVQEVKINQNKFTWEWATLGTFYFDADDEVYVSLDNVVNQKRGSITFDAVRFIGLWDISATEKKH